MSRPYGKRRRVNAKGRSNGKLGRFLALEHYVMNSPAYRSLTGNEALALNWFIRQYNGSNNGEFFYSVRDLAKDMGVSINTAHKCIQRLVQLGFIAPVQIGSFNWKTKEKKATRWRLTMFACNGALPTKDFMRRSPKKIDGLKHCDMHVSTNETA